MSGRPPPPEDLPGATPGRGGGTSQPPGARASVQGAAGPRGLGAGRGAHSLPRIVRAPRLRGREGSVYLCREEAEVSLGTEEWQCLFSPGGLSIRDDFTAQKRNSLKQKQRVESCGQVSWVISRGRARVPSRGWALLAHVPEDPSFSRVAPAAPAAARSPGRSCPTAAAPTPPCAPGTRTAPFSSERSSE